MSWTISRTDGLGDRSVRIGKDAYTLTRRWRREHGRHAATYHLIAADGRVVGFFRSYRAALQRILSLAQE